MHILPLITLFSVIIVYTSTSSIKYSETVLSGVFISDPINKDDNKTIAFVTICYIYKAKHTNTTLDENSNNIYHTSETKIFVISGTPFIISTISLADKDTFASLINDGFVSVNAQYDISSDLNFQDDYSKESNYKETGMLKIKLRATSAYEILYECGKHSTLFEFEVELNNLDIEGGAILEVHSK